MNKEEFAKKFKEMWDGMSRAGKRDFLKRYTQHLRKGT